MKTNGIKFKIDYSEDYLENNLMNQIHINTIKSCIFISLFLVSSIILYVFYSNYEAMQKVDNIKGDIEKAIAEYQSEEKDEDKEEEIPPITEDNNEQDSNHQIQIGLETRKEMIKDYAALLNINKDTVGWLKVNNTNVDYPVVQSKDNDYYLSHNFKNERDKNGWIFMDYRANSEELSQNTIIFGHNMYYSGVMFGTLSKAKQASWYKNKDNQIIEFDTLYEEIKWQIFSIYVVPSTNDYLIANFSNDDKYQSFLNMIIDRSMYDFNVPVGLDDKILTLSTCTGDGSSRLVIHAVLIK